MDEYDEYFCPHCGAILNEQNGSDPENDTWTCTECGMLLTDEDFFGEEENGVVGYCKNCGAILNKQDGFSKYDSSWMCQVRENLNKDKIVLIGFFLILFMF